jgi:hypothetical protein
MLQVSELGDVISWWLYYGNNNPAKSSKEMLFLPENASFSGAFAALNI